MNNKFLWLVLLLPLLFSCQKYNKAPFDEKEKAIRNFPEAMDVLVLDSLWQKRDSLSYLRLKKINKLLLKNSETIPNWVDRFNNLKWIIIANDENNFENIPESIGKLKTLEIFDVSENNISNMPETLYNISSLKVLDVDNNNISTISKKVSKLSNLESLSLRSNKINQLPTEICQLSKLESLILEDTKIETLPSCLGNLQNLDWLNVSGTQLTEFPIEILNAPKLETIDARRLKLKNYKEVKAICKEKNISFHYDE